MGLRMWIFSCIRSCLLCELQGLFLYWGLAIAWDGTHAVQLLLHVFNINNRNRHHFNCMHYVFIAHTLIHTVAIEFLKCIKYSLYDNTKK